MLTAEQIKLLEELGFIKSANMNYYYNYYNDAGKMGIIVVHKNGKIEAERVEDSKKAQLHLAKLREVIQ